MSVPDFISIARKFLYDQSFCYGPDDMNRVDERHHDERLLAAYLRDAYDQGYKQGGDDMGNVVVQFQESADE